MDRMTGSLFANRSQAAPSASSSSASSHVKVATAPSHQDGVEMTASSSSRAAAADFEMGGNSDEGDAFYQGRELRISKQPPRASSVVEWLSADPQADGNERESHILVMDEARCSTVEAFAESEVMSTLLQFRV